jgi:hypothetical protein
MVQEYNNSEESMVEHSESSFINQIVEEHTNEISFLDQVRKVFDQAIRETNYFITQVDFFFFFINL